MLESRRCLAGGSLWVPLVQTAIESVSVSVSTEHKPQSKVWEHGGDWWSVLPDSSGTWLWRLDSGAWSPVVQLSSDDSTKADVKVSGDLAHVLMFQGETSELVTVEYAAGDYSLWSAQPQVVSVTLGSSVEAATLEVDSTGRMWIAYDRKNEIEVRYSDGLYTSFSNPIVVASGITSDDISSIIAMPGGKIGVFWSDQNSELFGFRTHVDGANPQTWSANELPASQSAKSTGAGFSDDHVNLATSSDGTVYAAVKTSYDSSGSEAIALLVRRPNGVWDDAYTVDNSGTRPIVIVSETHNELAVVYTERTNGGDIVLRGTSLDQIEFGPTQTVLAGSFNNATSSKAAMGQELLVLAHKSGTAFGSIIDLGPFGGGDGDGETNTAPLVSAGADQIITLPVGANLSGSASDDGLPSGTLTTTWTKLSGSGTVNFGNANALATTATFSQAGTYVLQLTASDGALQSSDQVTVGVQAAPTSGPTTVTFQDGVNGYQGTRDTMLLGGSQNATGGSETSLNVDGSPDASVLISWDTSAIQQGSVIQSATITLQVTNRTSHSYPIYAMNRAWSESQATWNVASQGVNWSAAGAQGAADHGTTAIGQLSASSTGQYVITLNAAGVALVQSWVDSPGSNFGIIIQNYTSATNGADFDSREVSGASDRPKLSVSYTGGGGQTNTAPQVNAGADQTITLPSGANLSGSASDDGLPSGTLTTTWTKFSGQGTVSFGNASATSTTASFSQAGTYVLQLTASDGTLQSSDQVTVEVLAAPDPPQGEAGLVGWWTLDDDGTDQSGSGNHGTAAGSASYGAGRISSALLLASSGARLVVPDSSSLDITDTITLAAWIQPDRSGTQYVIAKKEYGNTDGYELSLSSTGKVFVRFNQSSNGNSYRVDSSTTYPTDGQTWMHIAATYDGTTIKLFINGQLQSSKTASFQIATNDLPLSLGAEQDGYRGMTGALDDVRVYSRALSDVEVAALYNL